MDEGSAEDLYKAGRNVDGDRRRVPELPSDAEEEGILLLQRQTRPRPH